jgi:NADH:ubiquinone reductase (H+-translocating)
MSTSHSDLQGTRTRILILGGGFAGVYTARHLEQDLKPDDAVEITLINRDNFFLYTPMLTEVAASAIETTHTINPLRSLFKRTRFVEGDVTGIDTEQRVVSVRLPDGRNQPFGYEHLVLALGSITAFHGMKAVEEHAFPIKTLADAIQIRNRTLQILETAAVEQDPVARAELLTFVLVGGGFTGVEMTGALDAFVREALKAYPSIKPDEIRIVLVEGAKRLLPEFDEHLATFAQRRLEDRGVEVRLGELVTGATARQAQLKDGSSIPTRTLIWSSGVMPEPMIAQSNLPTTGRGWVQANADMSVPGCPGVWAIGDCAQIPNPLQSGKPQPALAQTALREARQLSRNIVASMRGEAPQPFRYRVIGQMAMLGYHDGIGTIGPVRVRGYLAWALWRAYYLWRLPRLAKKVRVAMDWLFADIFGPDISEIKAAALPSLATSERDAASSPSPKEQSHKKSEAGTTAQ